MIMLNKTACHSTVYAIVCRSFLCTVKTMPSVSMVATRCRSCGSLKCHCCPQNGYACASFRNLASERHMGQDCDGSKMEHGSGLISDACKSDPEFDGAVSVLDEENICSGNHLALVHLVLLLKVGRLLVIFSCLQRKLFVLQC